MKRETCLYIISCTFKPRKHSKIESAIAICTDPDTPVLFVRPNGKPYMGKSVWNYDLHHYMPWTKLEIQP